MKKYFGLILVIVLIGIAIWEFVDQSEPQPKEQLTVETQTESNEGATRSAVATDFTLPLLNGGDFSLSSTRGKITIVNFWASWCGPCQMEAPHLQSFYEKYKDRVEIVAVNATHNDKVKNAQKFVDENGLTFPILLDETGEINKMYGAFSYPLTVFLNEKGEIIHEYRGPMEEQFMADLLNL